ncbi:PDT-domain-containing protein [Trametopsis cervina]|nr:PDT-domain-containing protein [Trametopsis cervina]
MDTAIEESHLPQLVCLGPLGTYTHQVAYENFGSSVSYVQCNTIRDVFEAVSQENPYGVVPQENSTFGSVIDTYDYLRSTRAGTEIYVRGAIILKIQHCLVGRKGLQKENIKRVISHEQALGQCRDYILANLPDAVLKKESSTAAAAQALSEEDPEDMQSAVICSALCVNLFPNLEIVESNIQDKQDNYTRFFVLSNSHEGPLPLLHSSLEPLRALIRVNLAADDSASSEDGQTSPATYTHNRPLHMLTSTLLTTFGVPVTRIDRRPSLNDIPFEDMYFLELEELGVPVEVPDRSQRIQAWMKRVNAGVQRVKAAGSQATVLGVW